MNAAHLRSRALIVGALFAPLVACGTPKASEADGGALAGPGPDADAPVLVVGTVLEASSGRPCPGVRIEGPGGTQAETDADGRFVLRGLGPGMQGELLATSEEGLTARNRLRPLKAGQLEVVLYLR